MNESKRSARYEVPSGSNIQHEDVQIVDYGSGLEVKAVKVEESVQTLGDTPNSIYSKRSAKKAALTPQPENLLDIAA